jgi:hypothetical protein
MQLVILAICLLGTTGIVVLLYALSPISKEIQRGNFNRTIKPHSFLQLKNSIDIKYNSFYFAGSDSKRFFLGNLTAPFHVLTVAQNLSDSQHVTIKLRIDSIATPQQFRLVVSPPWFYLGHGTMPALLRGNTHDWVATPIRMNDTYFIEYLPTGNSSFVLKSYSQKSRSYELVAFSEKRPIAIRENLLEKQIDGMFCLDGELHYEKKNNTLIYLHYYRNEIIITDSSLNLKHRTHTIDTFSKVKLKISKIGKKNESMLSAPPRQVNIRSSLSHGRLIVQSNILSVGEEIETFLKNTIIDVYESETGSYLYSFYIPPFKDKSPIDFLLTDNTLAVLYDNYLVTYELLTDNKKPGD